MALSFLFGGNTGETPETLKRKRELALAIMGAQGAPKNVGEGLNALGAGIAAGIMNRRADRAESAGRSAASDLFNRIIGQTPNVSAPTTLTPGGGNAGGGSAVASAPVNMTGNDVYSGFMDTVDDTITNPFGLAAVAATGQAESRFSPGNANRTWSDPSESGQAGTAGGIMSWRGPRLANLQAYAASKGEQGNGSPQTQAEFLLQEDPNLITALNNAKSVEEAQQLMNRAWQFAGWNRPGGEAAERLSSANAFLPKFQGQGQEVASLDPAAGMPPQNAADAVTAMGQGGAIERPFGWMPEPANSLPSSVPPPQPAAANLPPLQPPQTVATPPVPSPPDQWAGLREQDVAPQQVAQAQPQQSAPDVATLYQILTHPFASPEQKAVAQMMLQQQMQAAENAREQQVWLQRQQYETDQKRSDPAYQLGLEKTRQEVENLKTPEYQTLTPEERQALGIPDTDQRVYQRSRGGKLDAVGGVGQTINVGNEVDARKAAAESLGLKPEDPRYQSFILTGKFPREDAQALTATDKKAILEADEMVAANENAITALQTAKGLSGDANAGWFAAERAAIGNNLPDWAVPDFISSPQSSEATTNFDNAVIGQALTSLRTIFGSNPTEGERKILLDLQGSSGLPVNVRNQIIDRALEMAKRRLDFNRQRASGLRGGDYYKPGAEQPPPTGKKRVKFNPATGELE